MFHILLPQADSHNAANAEKRQAAFRAAAIAHANDNASANASADANAIAGASFNSHLQTAQQAQPPHAQYQPSSSNMTQLQSPKEVHKKRLADLFLFLVGIYFSF